MAKVIISVPVGNQQYVVIREREYIKICEEIEASADLVAELQDYKMRWIEVNEGDDDLAFTDLPQSMPVLRDIIKRHTSSEKSAGLAGAFLGKYLGLEQWPIIPNQ